MNTFPKHTRCPHHLHNVFVGVGCHQCPHNLGEADEGKSIKCALGGPTQKSIMINIEQRAIDFAEQQYSPSYPFDALAFGYRQGATKQRDIDIEKAAEWMKIAFAPVAHHYQCGIDGLVEEFKKAMEL